MKLKPDIILADLQEAIEAIPTDQQIIIAMRYGDGPQELRDKIAGIRNKLETLKTKVST